MARQSKQISIVLVAFIATLILYNTLSTQAYVTGASWPNKASAIYTIDPSIDTNQCC
jgi:hypothetical protein